VGLEALPPPGARDALYVLDLYGLVWRFFRAQGGQRWAWRRFADMVRRVLRERSPGLMAVASDNPWPTWRHEAAPETWKATRPKLPAHERAALLEQVRYATEVLADVFGVRHFAVRGYDGDDVVATLAERGLRERRRVVVVGHDKDFCQLVRNDSGRRLVVWDGREEVLDPDGVRRKFGVRPEQMADYQALVGDSSDNVRGVPGVGPRGAELLLGKFGTLDAALESAEREAAAERTPGEASFWVANGRYLQAMRAGRADAEKSRELVTLRRDVPLPLGDLSELDASGALP
jgi:DNA polymerase-1